MQAAKNISCGQLRKIIEGIYGQGEVVVKEAYSDFESPTREFKTVDALLADMAYESGQKISFFYYQIYYPETKGYTCEKRIELQSGKCGGQKFRFCQIGWGLIQLQCNFKYFPKIECRIAVNSSKRAGNWYQTCPDHKDPNLWDWKIINLKAGRLIRLLRKQVEQSG